MKPESGGRGPGPDSGFRRRNLGRLLIRAFNEFETYHVARLRDEGFDDFQPSDTQVLRNIEMQGSRIGDIARRAKVTPQAVSQMVASLESRGYVRTTRDPDDGRARLVCPTPRALDLIGRGQAITRELYEAWSDVLGEADFELLCTLLERLVFGLAPEDEGMG